MKSLWERLRTKLGAKNRSHAIAILYGRAQLAQAAELKRSRTLLETDLIGVVKTDAEGRIWDANQAYLNLMGYSREELTGLKCFDLVSPTEVECSEESLTEMLQTGRMSPIRKDCIAKTGERIPVLVGGIRLDEGCDRAICYVIRLPD